MHIPAGFATYIQQSLSCLTSTKRTRYPNNLLQANPDVIDYVLNDLEQDSYSIANAQISDNLIGKVLVSILNLIPLEGSSGFRLILEKIPNDIDVSNPETLEIIKSVTIIAALDQIAVLTNRYDGRNLSSTIIERLANMAFLYLEGTLLRSLQLTEGI